MTDSLYEAELTRKQTIKHELERLARKEFKGIKSETKHIWGCFLADGKRKPKEVNVFQAECIVEWVESLLKSAILYEGYKKELHLNHPEPGNDKEEAQ